VLAVGPTAIAGGAAGEDARTERVMARPADGCLASPVNPDNAAYIAADDDAPHSRARPTGTAVLTPMPQTPESHFGRHRVAPALRRRCATSPAVSTPGHYRGLRPAHPPHTQPGTRLSFDPNSRTVAESRNAASRRPACRSSDASVLTALMTAGEPQQPGYLSYRDAAAAPLDRFPQRQTLIVSHRPQRLPSLPLSVPNQSIAFTKRGQHRDRQTLSGSPGALPRRGPLRTVRARFPGTRLKQAPQACVQVEQLAPALPGRRFADARSGCA
jgi:hypothetical protein